VATAEVQQIQFALAIADGMRKNTQEMKDNIVEFMCCFCNYFLRKIRNRFIMIVITTRTCLSFSKLIKQLFMTVMVHLIPEKNI